MTSGNNHGHAHSHSHAHRPDQHHGHGPESGHRHGGGDADVLAEMVDLDAEVLHEYLGSVHQLLWDRAGGRTRRILDLGAGTGTGAVALAGRFPEARVVALDVSEVMLERVRAKVAALGLGDRVRTRQADLDEGWPALEPVDLVWASASLHHMADPDRVLADVFATLRPGGLFAAVELESFPFFLPHDAGRPGLEERCHAALRSAVHDELPTLGSDWGPALRKAGFVVEDERRYDIELTAPLPPATGRYAQVSLSRLRSGLGDRLDPADAAALDALLAGDGLAARTDLSVRTSRTVWLAVRP